MKYFLTLAIGFSFFLSAEALRLDMRQQTNTGDFVPYSCEVWNDGCNDCKQTDSGYICPPKNCATMRMGYCRVEKDASDVGDMAPPRNVKPRPTRPANCQRWFDGCNTCAAQPNGVSTTCTMMACEIYDEPRCLEAKKPDIEILSTPEIPLNCQSWFDGCNGCAVENGQLTFCTERACSPDQLEPAYCTAFKKETGPPADDKSEILEVTIGPEMVDCSAFRRTCMVMNGDPFPSWIDGFDFEAGFNYELRIKKTKRDRPLLDVGEYEYTLLEVLSKTSVQGEVVKYVYPPQKPRDESLIPLNCTSWYDGCNTCGVENGQVIYCTEMACDQTMLKPTECRAYAETEEVLYEEDQPDDFKKVPMAIPYEQSVRPTFWGFIKHHLFGWMK